MKDDKELLSNQLFELSKAQLGLDFHFDGSLLDAEGYHLVDAVPFDSQAKEYYSGTPFCDLIYAGKGLVAVAAPEIRNFIRSYCAAQGEELYRVFDAPQIFVLEKELNAHGYCVAHIAQFFLPDLNAMVAEGGGFRVEVFEGKEMEWLYRNGCYPMALTGATEGPRRDMLAAVCFAGNEVAGVAGCSHDCETMYQIGVDVPPAYRNRGAGVNAVARLTREILKRGKVPFYCCAYSNLASKRLARRAGFRDAWVEISAKRCSEDWIAAIRNLRHETDAHSRADS